MKRVLFLVSRLDKPSTRYRILAYLPFLRSQGIETRVVALKGSFLKRLTVPFLAGKYDVCVIQKKLLRTWELRLLRGQVRRLLYDLDDAIIYDDSGRVRPGTEATLARTAALVDGIFCGNPYLESLVKPFQSNIRILPTPVNTRTLTPGTNAFRSPVRIGWMGTAATFPYFQTLEKQWLQLLKELPVEFHIISSAFPEMTLPYHRHTWSEAEETRLLHELDIGLMPLPDTPFTRGKCGFKLLQYQAAGVAAVASAVGYNRIIVEHGRTGWLVEEGESWGSVIASILREPERVSEVRWAARRAVEATHGLDVLQEQFMEFLLGD